MPRTSIRLPFADGEYDFALPGIRITEIERHTDGIGAVYARTLRGRYPGNDADDPVNPVAAFLPTEGDYRFGELVHVIQQALIGGGAGTVHGQTVAVDNGKADILIRAYVLHEGATRLALKDVWKLAASILYALIEGYSPPGEAEAGVNPATQAKS